jgi:hypothetical protein
MWGSMLIFGEGPVESPVYFPPSPQRKAMNHGGLRDALQDDGSDTMDSDEACLATAVEAERFARYLALNLDGR